MVKKKEVEKRTTRLNDDVLCIDCRSCKKIPNVRSPDCMKCMVINIAEYGNAGRIRLRTSRDLEISGTAAEMMCELSMLYRSMMTSSVNGNRSCGDCGNSCGKVLDILWAGFPDPNFDSARNMMMSFRPSKSECNSCMQRTYRILDQTELGFNNFRKKISLETARNGGI